MLQAQIFIDKDELRESGKLYEFILDFLLQHNVAGATVYQGISGFGPNQHIKNPHSLFSFDETPLVITFIDENEKVRNVLRELRLLVKSGLFIVHSVETY
jgi:hypothetical protein